MTHHTDPPGRSALRARLLERLESTLRRQTGVENRLRHTNELPEKWADRAPLLGDEEGLTELDVEGRHEVASLRAALVRIDEGTYGVCDACGEPIAPARLAALPAAHTCVDCAE